MGRVEDGRRTWCGQFFFVYRRQLDERFSQLFSGAGKADLIAEKWGWYVIIHRLAGGNPLYIEAATEIEIESAFTYLAYEQDLNRKDKAPNADEYR